MSDRMVQRRSLLAAGTVMPFALSSGYAATPQKKGMVDAKDVGTVEDLMREHGVLRRCFLVYRECAARLRLEPQKVDAAALHDAAQLFREFGEDYHEKKLEETYIFPKVKSALQGQDASVDTLLAQHQRGREITDYILSVTNAARVPGAHVDSLARAFDTFEIMYANHTAREDTVVFPRWKDGLTSEELAALGDKFEGIEKATFGGDGFDQAVSRIARIEETLGLVNLAQFTAPAPAHE
jgi:hemerythrin-like domain-containing protein